MTSQSRFFTALLLATVASSAEAATFVVNSLTDQSDDDLGDGICETIVGNPIDGFRFICTLRGAIEQANSLPGTDTIEFSVTGTITPTVLLPAILEPVVIDGSTAPGAPTRDRDATALEQLAEPPTVAIDGGDLAPGARGLIVDALAAGSEIYNLTMGNFSGVALTVRGSSTAVKTIVSGNWIGLDSSLSPTPNGTGIEVTDFTSVRIGHDGTALAGTGRGNVIAGNTIDGISALASQSEVRGNWVGSAGDGALINPADTITIIGNTGTGIALTGINNVIEDNQVVGNGNPQVQMTGTNNAARGNEIFGRPITSTDLENPDGVVAGSSDGLWVAGDDTVVEANEIWANRYGLLLNSATGAGFNSNADVISNDLILNQFDGIDVRGIRLSDFDDNNIQLNRRYGIRIGTDQNRIRGNQIGIGFSPSQSVGNNLAGLVLEGNNNTVSRTPAGFSEPDQPNSILFNNGPGVIVLGDGNTIDDNSIVGNKGPGIKIDSANSTLVTDNLIAQQQSSTENGNGILITQGASESLITDNAIWQHPDAAIALSPTAGEQNALLNNTFFRNGLLSIDLLEDGLTTNDMEDTDAGPNRLQNYPVITDLTFNDSASPPTVTVTYEVDSTATSSSLPLFIEFLYADGLFERGGIPLNGAGLTNPTITYTPPGSAMVTLELMSSVSGGVLYCTATDDAGNTSEFSAGVEFGVIDDGLFEDGFEGDSCRPVCPITDPLCVPCPPMKRSSKHLIDQLLGQP